MTKIIAWNVNSIRSLVQKEDIDQFLKKQKCQIFCMSETKLSCPDLISRKDLSEKISGFRYRYYSTCSVKKGYSGTAIYSKKKPIEVTYGIEEDEHDNEGRVITLKFKDFILVHVYTPNSGQVLQRLDYRVNKWDKSFFKYIQKMQNKGNIILCGDLNVARYEIDIHSPKTNLRSAGYTKEERNSFNKYVDSLDLIDTYRHLNPNKQEYTYWSYLRQSRKNNKGWRIDYFLISKKLENKLKKSYILTEQMGSDHAPIVLELKFK
tara:strand:- start:1483 stop:2274 length:792 start_codon:yes stop_codon:yes gene_type:complete